MSGHGAAWLGMAWRGARRGKAWHGRAGRGEERGEAWRGLARRGEEHGSEIPANTKNTSEIGAPNVRHSSDDDAP